MGAGRKQHAFKAALLLIVTVLIGAGCGSFWVSVREGERTGAVKNANKYFKQGRCDRVLDQLDQAEAARDLGPYGAQATYQRAVCLENLGHAVSARANYWMVVDFYPESPMKPMALEKLGRTGDRNSLAAFRQGLSSVRVVPQIEIPSPRYSETAERSGLVGSAVVVFTMGADEKVSDIRVVQMDHPLLASWSIEAVDRATIAEGATPPDLPVQTITQLVFSSIWHGEEREADKKAR